MAADLTRATELTDEVGKGIRDAFEFHPWDKAKIDAGTQVRQALIHAVETIIANVPPGPDRTVAIRKLCDAGMDCNSAIIHGGSTDGR